MQLAPYDQNVRWQLVQLFLNEDRDGLAYRTLMPLANDPHNRSEDNPAVALLAAIKLKFEAKIADESAANDTQAAETEKAK